VSKFFFLLLFLVCYGYCNEFENLILFETQEINDASPYEYDRLAESYTSRAESYMLCKNHHQALKDFQKARFYLKKSQNDEVFFGVGFRTSFGLAIVHDNLGNLDEASQSIGLLHDYLNLLPSCNPGSLRIDEMNENYPDIIGPNYIDSSLCEEFVEGTAELMIGLASLSPNATIRIALIGVIHALKVRGIKCCNSGNFWKACVAPIARKWKEWKDAQERVGRIPDDVIYPSLKGRL